MKTEWHVSQEPDDLKGVAKFSTQEEEISIPLNCLQDFSKLLQLLRHQDQATGAQNAEALRSLWNEFSRRIDNIANLMEQ